jgi:hypothetical protein
MRKEKALNVSGGDNGYETGGKVARTTIFLTEVLNDNLDALALTTGVPKGEHVRRAITDYIGKQEGFNPHKKPKVRVSY